MRVVADCLTSVEEGITVLHGIVWYDDQDNVRVAYLSRESFEQTLAKVEHAGHPVFHATRHTFIVTFPDHESVINCRSREYPVYIYDDQLPWSHPIEL